ncbi:hypothetical protein SOP85_01830 [Pseudomonas sp. YuFO20]|uniref:hypothetical protein n=1 Tax=Pseudomonas sp. YuFO20 TaxID=3095362 RepID=UPI002B245A69|nr:hypothetical protein [Pseudomonas sp. YuFO20]MEB2514181.1 hypothetical protein [Pseudomonas sp. YuFO20]
MTNFPSLINANKYESYLSLFYKLIREMYTGRSKILSKYKISEKAHFLPVEAPEWLLGITDTPSDHLPITYCPTEYLLDPRETIKFCPECMRAGYHSVFFMLKSISMCAVHRCNLLSMCGLCCNRFLGTIPIDSYFDCPVTVGRTDIICRTCKLSWPDISEGHLDLSERADLLSALTVWKSHSDWYRSIVQGASQSSQLCKDYYSDVTRDSAIAPLEARYKLTSTERLLGMIEGGQKAYWIKFHNNLPLSEMATEQYHNLREYVAFYCLEIKQKYLADHDECCLKINSLTGYMPMHEARAPLCVPALAYVVLRLKLACAIWPTPNSVASEKSCFDNLFRYIEPDIKPAELRKLIMFIFLKIMGDIQSNVTRGRSFNILLRTQSVTNDFFYFRRTMYRWRTVCRSDFEMDSSCWISADGTYNKLSVMWYHDQSPYKAMMII